MNRITIFLSIIDLLFTKCCKINSTSDTYLRLKLLQHPTISFKFKVALFIRSPQKLSHYPEIGSPTKSDATELSNRARSWT